MACTVRSNPGSTISWTYGLNDTVIPSESEGGSNMVVRTQVSWGRINIPANSLKLKNGKYRYLIIL